MNSFSLSAYHRLPAWAKNLSSGAFGLKLRRWRYGRETDRLVTEARDREYWSSGQWQEFQERQLAILLARAAEQVPHYRDFWNARPKRTANQALPSLSAWPVLKKIELSGFPNRFLADDVQKRSLKPEQTSGTTGTPVRLWHSRETARAWYALMETRWRGWYGISRRDCWAILGGQLVVPGRQNKPPYWVWNAGLRQLYMSSYHLSAETCASYFQAMKQKKIVYLWSYASSLFTLALFASEQQLSPPQLKVVISNAEPLYAHQRELISRVFGCPVRDTYGMSEMACAASECEAGRMHLWPEAGICEVLHDHDDSPVVPGEPGRLVCTGLLNHDMPLIRYEVGDRVAIAPPGEKCFCGRTMPILLSVEGRNDDMIITPDGRQIGRLDPVFKCEIPIREGQIIQESLELIRMIVVPAPGFTVEHEQALIAALHKRVGDIRIQLEKVAEIPRSSNGKFRAVISKVKKSHRAGIPHDSTRITL